MQDSDLQKEARAIFVNLVMSVCFKFPSPLPAPLLLPLPLLHLDRRERLGKVLVQVVGDEAAEAAAVVLC